MKRFFASLLLLLPLLAYTQPRSLASRIPGGKSLAADTLTIVAVGDVMLGTYYPSKQYLAPNNDPFALLAPAANILKAGDLTFANLEGALIDHGTPSKRITSPSKTYAFAMPTAYAQALKKAGVDVVSLANNHSGDFGPKGRQQTQETLKRLGIAYAGLLDVPTAVLQVGRTKIGVCAFAPNNGTCPLNDDNYLRSTVQGLKQKCDIVIASCHMGAEGGKHKHITRKQEIFLGENRGNPHRIARILIDAGADLVIGHGPHLPRAIDLYKGKFIAYSLGNFATYGRFSLRGTQGLAPILEVKIDRNQGRFLEATIHSAIQEGEGGVQMDANRKALKEIHRLTQNDFPSSPLQINIETGQVLSRSKH